MNLPMIKDTGIVYWSDSSTRSEFPTKWEEMHPDFASAGYAHWRKMWKNGGILPGEDGKSGNALTVKDAMAHFSAPSYLNRYEQELIAEAVEPMLVITGLMERVQYRNGIILGHRVVSAIGDDFDMGEAEEYSDASIQIGPGAMTSTVGKVGAGLSFTQECLRYSSMPVIDMATREVVKALARFKEKKALRMLQAQGKVTHNNSDPTNSVYGVTRGRGFDGAANGSIIADDIQECMVDLMLRGFNPDVWIIHPLTWMMFNQDPVMRNLVNSTGVGVYFADRPAGNLNPRDFPEDPVGISASTNLTEPGATNGTKSGVNAYSQNSTVKPTIPGYFGAASNFNIIVSPFMTFDTTNNLCDIIVADRSQLGYHLVDEELTSEEWMNPANDMLRIKFRERYSFQVKNEARGINLIKNVAIVQNQIILPAQAQISVSSSALAAISRNTAVV